MRWFAKWFGGRTAEQEDEEPARHAPPIVRPASPAAPHRVNVPKAQAAKGFDPYNSGAFERRNAWERVPRR